MGEGGQLRLNCSVQELVWRYNYATGWDMDEEEQMEEVDGSHMCQALSTLIEPTRATCVIHLRCCIRMYET